MWNGWSGAVCGRGAHPGDRVVWGTRKTKGQRYQVGAGLANAEVSRSRRGGCPTPDPGVARMSCLPQLDDAGCMTNTTSASPSGPSTSDGTQRPVPENPYARPAVPVGDAAAAAPSNGFSIASLVLGIASIPTGWAIAGILAIVFGFLARTREPLGSTMSTWGIVLGFVGVFGWLVVAILGLAIVAPFAVWGAAFGWWL